ncbi:protein croquemort isoform X2 [Cylas formicarius]|uniref:protein croquemort isoform X2 n=1 Tax=Cylas formicarius TaxID=197179 RepID=UPI00295865FB|nr:protein croquemort isoform X2 [Cylas formicarius]
MGYCSPKCKVWTTFSISILLFVIGLLTSIFWHDSYGRYLRHQLTVSDSKTQGFKNWKETPIPMYLEFYMFNWTNSEDVIKYRAKPKFQECGPYVYYEHHIRQNVTFNNNDTVTYKTQRIWKFQQDMSTGSLDDNITTLNPIAVFVANMVKDEHYLVRRAVNFFFEEKEVYLTITRTVDEFLFKGYNDTLLNIALKLNISNLNLPYKTFGWFVNRNGSIDFDGVFNMYSGEHDGSKLGIITQWNYEHQTSYYPGECGIINGTSGELWYPPKGDEEVSLFAPDLCSNVQLHLNGTYEAYGLVGDKYIARDDVFDNGTFYPKQKCFANGYPTGLRSVSKCKYNAPAYMSFPHFYLADRHYVEQVEGMNPTAANHTTYLSLEPDTGVPLNVFAAFQLNLLMLNIAGINIFSNVTTTMIPSFWFCQRAEISKSLALLTRFLLILRKLVTYIGYGLIGLSLGLMFFFGYLVYRERSKSNEEEELLADSSN